MASRWMRGDAVRDLLFNDDNEYSSSSDSEVHNSDLDPDYDPTQDKRVQRNDAELDLSPVRVKQNSLGREQNVQENAVGELDHLKEVIDAVLSPSIGIVEAADERTEIEVIQERQILNDIELQEKEQHQYDVVTESNADIGIDQVVEERPELEVTEGQHEKEQPREDAVGQSNTVIGTEQVEGERPEIEVTEGRQEREQPQEDAVRQRKSRKRTRNEEKWACNVAKRKRDRGEEYTS